ncbi:MAG: sugar phosphate isomerase/epimerase [Clostridia bacterium]|nr:sugar phosphate isomerase/epimerase [Clostridia bacterium]
MALPVALQLYSVRNEMEKDFEGTIRKVAALGYQGVEFAGLFDHTAQQVKEICAAAGVEPVSAHVPLDELLADTKGTIAKYKEIGCRFIVIPYLPEERRPGFADFEKTLEAMKAIGAECKKQGLLMLYHNHDFEFVKLGDKYGLDVMYDTISADLLATELDTCWVNVGGENPAEYVLKYTGRAPVVHLKDFVMQGKEKPQKLYALIGIDDDEEQASEDAFSFKPVGSGVQDMPAILVAAEKAGAQWVVVEQDQPDKGHEELQCAQISRDFLKKLGW